MELFDPLGNPVEDGEEDVEMLRRLEWRELDIRPSVRRWMNVRPWVVGFRVPVPATLPDIVVPRFDIVFVRRIRRLDMRQRASAESSRRIGQLDTGQPTPAPSSAPEKSADEVTGILVDLCRKAGVTDEELLVPLLDKRT